MANSYVLTDGCYSDYHIIGVFSTAKNAERVQKIVGGDIEVLPLDPLIDALNKGLTRYSLLMRRDGEVEGDVQAQEVSTYELTGKSWLWERTKAPAYRNNPNIVDVLWWHGYAKDKKAAVKIANEVRTQMIAEGKWK